MEWIVLLAVMAAPRSLKITEEATYFVFLLSSLAALFLCGLCHHGDELLEKAKQIGLLARYQIILLKPVSENVLGLKILFPHTFLHIPQRFLISLMLSRRPCSLLCTYTVGSSAGKTALFI